MLLRFTTLGFAAAASVLITGAARAQMDLPDQAPPTPAEVFTQQCGTCHTLNAADPPRQGPTLAGVYGRKAGSVSGFQYSAGFAQAKFSWDEAHLDRWLTSPPSVIPTAIMPYRQSDPAIRKTIIDYLKGQH